MPAAFSEERNVTVCLSHRYALHGSPGGSMQHGQHTFRPDNKKDRRTWFFIKYYKVVLYGVGEVTPLRIAPAFFILNLNVLLACRVGSFAPTKSYSSLLT